MSERSIWEFADRLAHRYGWVPRGLRFSDLEDGVRNVNTRLDILRGRIERAERRLPSTDSALQAVRKERDDANLQLELTHRDLKNNSLRFNRRTARRAARYASRPSRISPYVLRRRAALFLRWRRK